MAVLYKWKRRRKHLRSSFSWICNLGAIVSGSSDEAGSGGTDVFDYIELAHAKSPLFFNFDFAPNQYSVLRPFSKLIDLDVWNYYYTEELNMGPIGKLPFYNRFHNLIETFLLMINLCYKRT